MSTSNKPALDDVRKYNAVRARAIDKASPENERKMCRRVLERLEDEFDGIAEAAETQRAKDRASGTAQPGLGGDPFDVLRERAASGDVAAAMFVRAIDWSLDTLKKEAASDFAEVRDFFTTASKRKDDDAPDRRGSRKITRAIKRGLSAIEDDALCVVEGAKLAKDGKTIDDGETLVLEIDIPWKLWIDIHDDPAAFVEWIDEHLSLDDDSDDQDGDK